MTSPSVVVTCDSLVHVYGTVGAEVAALRGVDLSVRSGEMVALLGPSGSGKSTLLWHLAGLLRPTAGTVWVNGHNLAALTTRQAAVFRQREIGVLVQNGGSNLLPYLSAVENVELAQRPTLTRGLLLKTASRRVAQTRAHDLLRSVGMDDTGHRPAGQLSGGEQQRVALAVALANEPPLLLADEPTSQLDPEAAVAVVDLFRQVNRDLGTTIVVVTHDPAVGAALGRTVTIRDGRVGAEGRLGSDYVVVGKDGTVQLPPELQDALPPGSLAHAIRTEHGVELRRADEQDAS
ncbi:ABC transporter ATP-binding protein [Acidothermaceae bacterium B102]|nr:ABC transporter ATP-binding protein [Acidothermaceae bacterium B102]